jgi:hypothetical protein
MAKALECTVPPRRDYGPSKITMALPVKTISRTVVPRGSLGGSLSSEDVE